MISVLLFIIVFGFVIYLLLVTGSKNPVVISRRAQRDLGAIVGAAPVVIALAKQEAKVSVLEAKLELRELDPDNIWTFKDGKSYGSQKAVEKLLYRVKTNNERMKVALDKLAEDKGES